MLNNEIAKLFYDIAEILDILKVQWKPRAYKRAAQNLESLGYDVKEIYETKGIKGLKEIPGIGEGIAKKIVEFIEKGKITEYEELKDKVPKHFLELINIPSLGVKKAEILNKKLGIENVNDLKKALKQHKIKDLEGFGVISEENILKGLNIFKKKSERVLLSYALPIAYSIKNILEKVNGIKRIDVAGSLRRMRETVKDIDILAISTNPKVIDTFCSLKNIKEIIAKGKTKATIFLEEGIEVDLRVVKEKSYGAALNYFTGSREHNIALRQISIKKGYKLNEYGLFNRKTNKFIGGKTEEELYKLLGMKYIEPELREDKGEIEASIKNKLPNLVELKDIKSDLQMHSGFSDGANTIEEMATESKKSLKYIAITDHYGNLKIANALNKKRFKKYSETIDKLNKKSQNFMILKGLEVDVDKNGDLECEVEVLKELDFCLASIHRAFKMPKEDMTKRICKAMENKYVNTIAHPTGRLLLERDSYEFEFNKICETAVKNNVALEINAFPNRLDISDDLTKQAIESKVNITIGTDSHAKEHLRFLSLGVSTARRGWAEKKNILNTLGVDRFLKVIRR